MQNQQEKKIPDDEIDVRSLGKKVYAILAYPFHLFFSNKIISLGFIVAAVVFAFGLKSLVPKTYKSSFIIRPLDRNERVHLKILRDIQVLLKYKDYAGISAELKLDSLTAKTLVELETANPSLKNPLDSTNCTEVSLSTTDYTTFAPLQKALLDYLENNPYFFKIKELQKKQVALELAQVEKDLASLDSLKALQLRNYGKSSVGGGNALVLDEVINPVAAYTFAVERIQKKSNLLARNVFVDNFQVVKSVVSVKHPVWPPRVLILCLYTIPAFLLICFFFLNANRKKSMNHSKNN